MRQPGPSHDAQCESELISPHGWTPCACEQRAAALQEAEPVNNVVACVSCKRAVQVTALNAIRCEDCLEAKFESEGTLDGCDTFGDLLKRLVLVANLSSYMCRGCGSPNPREGDEYDGYFILDTRGVAGPWHRLCAQRALAAHDSAKRECPPIGASQIAETLRGVPPKRVIDRIEHGNAGPKEIFHYEPDYERQAEAVRALYASRESNLRG